MTTEIITDKFDITDKLKDGSRYDFPGVDHEERQTCGPGRVKVVASSFRPTGQNLSEDFFFLSSPNFGQKSGPNLSEDLFFRLHLILGKNRF